MEAACQPQWCWREPFVCVFVCAEGTEGERGCQGQLLDRLRTQHQLLEGSTLPVSLCRPIFSTNTNSPILISPSSSDSGFSLPTDLLRSLPGEVLETCPAQRSGALGSWQYVTSVSWQTKRPPCPGRIRPSIAGQARAGIVLLCSALGQTHLHSWGKF